MCKMCERSLCSPHEEAGSRMTFPLYSEINPENVLIRTSDTNVFGYCTSVHGLYGFRFKYNFRFLFS